MNASAFTLLALASALAQLPASPDPKPVPVTGVVVDASDRPVAGADVWLAEAIPPDQGRRFGVELWYASLTGPGEGAPPILAHGQSDAAGRFTLAVPADAVARRSPPPLAVWAASRRGREIRVAFRRLPRIVLADDPPVRVTLGPPAHADLTVLTPDRKPAAGARVVPTRTGDAPIPEPLGRLLAANADADGRAVIPGWDAATLDEIQVETKGFGTQILGLPDSRVEDSRGKNATTRTTRMMLASVGRVAGRLMAPGDEPIRGATVRAVSQVEGYMGSGVRGTAAVACDEHGRFEIPAVAAGMLALELEFDPATSLPLRGAAPKGLVVKAGQTTEVTIALRETVVVRGLVREKGTNRPIAGVKIVFNSYFGGDRFINTGADGRFAGRILRDVNQPYGWPIRLPVPFYEPADMTYPPQEMPRQGVAELELPPLEPRRGADVRGIARGEDGEPVAGALVEAICYGSGGQTQMAMARTDRAGNFVLHGVDPIAELNLNAWDGFASTAAVTVRAAAAEERPIALTLSPKNTVPIGGRVVGADGLPIAGAAVRIRRQVRGKDGRVILDDPVAAGDGSFVLHAGADGRFRGRGRYPSQAEYYAEATAPGRLAARSTAVVVDHDSGTPVVLVLHRVRTLEGRVVDRRGRPIAGALVRQSGDGPMPTETTTADDGRFRLPGVIEGSGLVLAEKGGFRSSLQPAGDGSKLIEVVLGRTDEPRVVAYRTLPPVLPVDEEKALAHGLIEPLVAKALKSGNDDDKYVVLRDAAGIDPHATIEWLDETKFAAPVYADYVRDFLAKSVARESIDEATAILEASTDAGVRTGGYIELVVAAPNVALERQRQLLDQALLNSKNVTSLLHRFNGLGQIANRLVDIGEGARARAVLGEARELAGNLRKGDKNTEHCLLYITEALSRLDLPAALKIVEDQERDARKNEPGDRSRIYERYFGLIAHKLADRSPAEAERILNRMHIRPTLDREIVAVCARMAAKDLTRARRIAEKRISPDGAALRPYAFGLMAQAIAATDRTEAVRLLDDAFAELERVAARESDLSEPGAMVVAAALLPAVEQAAPDRLGEFIGRAILLRHARGDQIALGEYALARHTSQLTMLIARYDRGLAARILQPQLDQIGTHRGNRGVGVDFVAPNALAALALIDPRRAVAMVEALPADLPSDDLSNGTKYQARTFVAKLLALHGDDRWRMVYQQFLYLWTPDQRYL